MPLSWNEVRAGALPFSKEWADETSEGAAIEQAAQGVLAARTLYPYATPADIFDPLSLPPDLRGTHQELDKVVDSAYGRRAGFPAEAKRVSYLLKLDEAVVTKPQ